MTRAAEPQLLQWIMERQQTYAYDTVNRLASAAETGTWLENYGYDAFGNRWVTNVVGLPPLTLETPAGPTWCNGNNRINAWGIPRGTLRRSAP
jgi:YD repeat-containing protein